MSEIGQIKLIIANRIRHDSWLMEDKYLNFRRAHDISCNKVKAIPCLSKVSPEEFYNAMRIVLRYMGFNLENIESKVPGSGKGEGE